MQNQLKKSALKKPDTNMTRRILVAATEQEQRRELEDVKYMVRLAINEVYKTIQVLRKSHGILLPNLLAEWDLVPTEHATPTHTITAFGGNKSEVRITLHLDELVDNTTTIELEALGISHLIGISTSANHQHSWKPSNDGGMIAVVESPVVALPSLLHDMLLDMVMIHAKAQPWSNIRKHISSHVVAELKARYIHQEGLLNHFPYGANGENSYLPFAAFIRSSSLMNGSNSPIDPILYVKLWTGFAVYAKQITSLPLTAETWHNAQHIIISHINGGQISPSKLTQEIDALIPGYYCLYFLSRRSKTRIKQAELSAFFGFSMRYFRTQRWVIYPRDKFAKQASLLLHEGFLNMFPFYVGEKK